MTHALGYARVSTTQQDPQLQLAALEQAGCYLIRTDVASGKNADRPQLQQLLGELRPGDTLVVWRLDRLGRSVVDLLRIVDELRERGVGFRSLTEGLDTTTAAGRFTLTIMAALAEMERELMRERTLAGLAAAKAGGRTGGRPSVMTPAMRRRARTLRASGASLREIADALGVARTTVHRALNPETAQTSQTTGDGDTPATDVREGARP